MNSFFSDRSFNQNQNTPYQLAEDSQAAHQFRSPSGQNPNNEPFKIYSQTESDYNVVSSQGGMARATPNPANFNSEIRISADEDHKHPEVQSGSNTQNKQSSSEGSDIHESSSSEDEGNQLISGGRSHDEKIAYYKEEIEKNRTQSKSKFNFSNTCRDSFRADKCYEEHLRCEEKISAFHNMCGHVLSKQYKYNEAVLEFEKASKIRNQVVSNYSYWGRQLKISRKEFDARKKYEDAQYFKSYLTQIYGNWGWALTRLKEFDFAIQKYSEALEIYWNVIDICKRWGYRFAQKEKFQDATKKCLSRIYRNWGYTLSQQGKYKEALDKYYEIEQFNFKDNSIYTDMGYCCDRLGRQDDAVQCYRDAIDLNPGSRDIQCEAYYLWGRTLDEKGEHEEAIKKLKEASKLEGLINKRKGKRVVIKCSNRLGLVYYKLKRYREALTLYKKLRDENHRYAFVSIYVGLIYAQMAYCHSKGEKYLDCSEDEKIESEEDYLKLAHKYCNEGISIYENAGFSGDCVNAIEKEIERNEKQLKRNPQNNDESRAIIARMEFVLQKVLDLELIQEDSFNNKVPKVQSFEILETSVELESLDNSISRLDGDSDLSRVSIDGFGDSLSEELKILDNFMKEFGVDLDLSIVRNKESDDSISEAPHILDSLKPKNAHEQIAYIEKYVEHFKAASKNWLDSYRRNAHQESATSEKSLKKYIKLELGISSIHSNWGYQLSTLFNYEEAVTKFEEAATIIEKLRNLCKIGSKNWLHSCYYEANKGYRINKQLSGVYKNWGFALSCMGKFEDAADKSRKAQKENPKNGSAYKSEGFALSRLGKHEGAIQSYEKALKYCSDTSKIRIHIGFSFTMLGDFDEACKIYESIINDNSQEISIKCDAYYEWANTLDEKGDSEGAIKKINEALELQKSSDKQPDIRLLNRLGLLYYHKKEYKKAYELFEEIIKHDPSYGYSYINQGLVYNQWYHLKLKNDSSLHEKEKDSADHSILLNEYNSYIVEEVSRDLSHQPDSDKIEIGTVEKRLKECKDDIDTYQRTVTEVTGIKNILKNLETNKENGRLEWDDQKDKYKVYGEAIILVKQSSCLRHDYIDIYKREAKKIEERLCRCKKEKEDLEAKIRLSKPKNMDKKYNLNESVLANSVEMQGNPPGF